MDARTFNRESVSRIEERRGWLGSQSSTMAGEDVSARAWADEGLPDMAFDDARDELATGEDIYDGAWPAPVRHPSKTLLQDVTAANPRGADRHARPGTPGAPASKCRPRQPSSSSADGTEAPPSNSSGARTHPDAA